ncbi:MAG TPA: hypothetical protein VGG48_08780 [Rhizomicrobium sp.]|jgi:hypothetical protein
MTQPDNNDDEDETRYRRSLFGLGAAILIVIIGLWAMYALHQGLEHERCVEERRVCDAIPLDGQ